MCLPEVQPLSQLFNKVKALTAMSRQSHSLPEARKSVCALQSGWEARKGKGISSWCVVLLLLAVDSLIPCRLPARDKLSLIMT